MAEHESAAGTPEDVDPALVGAAADAIHAFYAAHPENESEEDAIRVLLAANRGMHTPPKPRQGPPPDPEEA